jgi:O-antigen/teichoic acid export membrane protein
MNLSNIIKKLSGPVIFNILGSLFGILSTIIISRYYGSEKLGTISLSLKITQILMVVSLFGFREQIIKNISIYLKENDSHSASNLVSNIKFFSRISSLIITAIVLVILYFFSFLFEKDKNFVPFMQIFILSLIFIVQTKNNTFILISMGKYKRSVLFDGFYNTVFLLVLLLIVIILKINVTIEILAVVYFLSRLFNYVTSIYLFRRNPFFKKIKNRDFSYIKNGKDFFAISVINTLIANIDLVIIGIILTPKLVAIYAVCSRISQILELVTYVLSTAISPEIATLFHDKNFTQLKHVISKYMSFSFLIASIFCLSSLFLSSTLLNLWGDDFSNYSKELTIMIIATSIGFVFSPYANFLSMTGHQKVELRLNFIISIIFILILIFLTINFGLIGSALAFLVRIFSINFSRFYFSKQILKETI